jgi:hypothetical protein
MGIRGVDIQVAIQRAADADKLQQGQIGQARAGEAGAREEAELERTRNREQPQKSEHSGQVTLRPHREGQNRSSRNKEESEEAMPDTEEGKPGEGKPRRLSGEGHLDILI